MRNAVLLVRRRRKTCGLTPRSSGAPTAGHQARSGGTRYIFANPGLASYRCRPLSSNVRPHKMSIAVPLAKKLQSFAGLELSAVSFDWDTVQLRFVGEYNVSVRIGKTFQLQNASGQASNDIVPGGGGNPQVAGDLASLVKARLQAITYKSNELALLFAGGQYVRVPLANEDFDPVEISCSHHLSPGELEWHTVVTAVMAAQ